MSPRARDTWTVTVVDLKPGRYDTLQPLAQALQLPFEKALQVELRIDRVPVRLSLSIDSGVVRGVNVSVSFETTPEATSEPFVRLRKETDSDQRDKAEGLSVEVQVGEPGFDRLVYIDSNAGDAEVHRLLARPEARAAVRALLDAGLDELALTPLAVTCTVNKPSGVDAPFGAERMLRVLEALLTLQRGGGPRGAPKPLHGENVPTRAGLAFLVGGLSLVGAHWAWAAGFLFPAAGFVVAGFAGTTLLRPRLARAVAGDSGSGNRLRAGLFFTFLAAGCFGAAGLLAFNALADPHEVAQLDGVVTGSRYDDEDDTYKVSFRLEDGREDSKWVRFQPLLGAPVRVTWRPGRLVRWDEQVELR